MSNPNTSALADIITVIMETHLRNDHGLDPDQIEHSLHELTINMKDELIKRITESLKEGKSGTSH